MNENKIINIKGKRFGAHQNLNICVPMVGETLLEIKMEIESIKDNPPDVLEWRMDRFQYNNDFNRIVEVLEYIKSEMDDIPLIITLIYNPVSSEEEKKSKLEIIDKLSSLDYGDLYNINPIGLEDVVENIIKDLNIKNKYTILTARDFYQTLPKDELIATLKRLEYLGADMCQLVVTPNDDIDVLVLLETIYEFSNKYGSIPCIGISATHKGFISRVIGYKYGSAMTYAYSKKPSFAGQIKVEDMKKIYEVMDKYKE